MNTHFDRNRHEKATEPGEIPILNLQNWYHDWYHQLVLVPTHCGTLAAIPQGENNSLFSKWTIFKRFFTLLDSAVFVGDFDTVAASAVCLAHISVQMEALVTTSTLYSAIRP